MTDKVKTPVLSIIGQSEVEVLASVEIEQKENSTNEGTNTLSSKVLSNQDKKPFSRSEINQMKLAVRQRLSRIKAYQNLSPARKRRIVKSLTRQLENLKSL